MIVAVGVRIHHITANAEFLFVAHVEVKAEVLRGVHAAIAAATRESGSAAVGEAHVVGVVGAADERELVAIAEVVHHGAGAVAVVGAVAGGEVAHPALVHAFLHSEVNHCFVLAVVNAGEAGKVALAVNHLQLVDDVGRQVFACHVGVVGEKLLAVDQKFGHGLAVGGDGAVGADFNARHTLQQVLYHGVHLGLVAVGIIFYGVLFYGNFGFHAHHGGFFEHDGAWRHGYFAQRKAAALRHGDGSAHVVIAQISHLQHIFAGCAHGNGERAVDVRGGSVHECAVAVGFYEFDCCFD